MSHLHSLNVIIYNTLVRNIAVFRQVFRLEFSISCFRQVIFDELFSVSFPRFDVDINSDKIPAYLQIEKE